METGTSSIVSVPQADIAHYLSVALNYLVAHFPDIVVFVRGCIDFLIVISFPLSIVFIVGIIVSVERIKKIRKKEKEFYEAKVDEGYVDTQAPDPLLAQRWTKVLEHLESLNDNDWRQAIIEADIILEDILRKIGYQGEGVGEMLRRAERADFQTLDQAGEAHGVRNRIAHDGAAYVISQHEAKRVINLYRQVFEEFFYI